jgi:hypothetical protein
VGAIPGLVIAALFAFYATEPERGGSERADGIDCGEPVVPSVAGDGWEFCGAVSQSRVSVRDAGDGDDGVYDGRDFDLDADVSAPLCGDGRGQGGDDSGRDYGGGWAGGTAIGGWLAQRWLRTNHRALYLLSAWSMILTLPLAALVFFGPAGWSIPALFAAEFFLFLNTGPLNAAICNSVSAAV